MTIGNHVERWPEWARDHFVGEATKCNQKVLLDEEPGKEFEALETLVQSAEELYDDPTEAQEDFEATVLLVLQLIVRRKFK